MQGSTEWLKNKPKFLSQIYCMIEEKIMRGKTCSKSFKALYCSGDIEMPGALRVIPYRRDGDAAKFYPVEVIFSFKCIARIPLLEIAADVETPEEELDHECCMEIDEDEVEGAHKGEQGGYTPQ